MRNNIKVLCIFILSPPLPATKMNIILVFLFMSVSAQNFSCIIISSKIFGKHKHAIMNMAPKSVIPSESISNERQQKSILWCKRYTGRGEFNIKKFSLPYLKILSLPYLGFRIFAKSIVRFIQNENVPYFFMFFVYIFFWACIIIRS